MPWNIRSGRRPLDARRVRRWVRDDFGIDLSRLDELTIGTDRDARSWRGTDPSGERYAVKFSRGGTSAGLLVPAYLSRLGIPGIVPPIPTRLGSSWSGHQGGRLSVVPWISDHRALDGTITAAHWRALGSMLARVHTAPVSPRLAAALPSEDHRHDELTPLVTDVDGRAREPTAATDPVARNAASAWTAASDSVEALLAAADTLGAQLQHETVPTVLCHGDAHLGNVLLGPVDQVWLVDWDDAMLAPRERDVAVAVGGVLAEHPPSPQQRSWFFEGYGSADVVPRRLLYYRCIRALSDLADFTAEALDVTKSATERARALKIVRGVLSPTGQVQLALDALTRSDAAS